MDLQGPGVAGLPQAFNGPGVPKEMRVNAFADAGPRGGFLDDLPGPPTIDLEDPVVEPQFLVEGEALETMGQAVRTGDQAGLAPFSQDVKGGAAFIAIDLTRGEA